MSAGIVLSDLKQEYGSIRIHLTEMKQENGQSEHRKNSDQDMPALGLSIECLGKVVLNRNSVQYRLHAVFALVGLLLQYSKKAFAVSFERSGMVFNTQKPQHATKKIPFTGGGASDAEDRVFSAS